MRLRIPRRLLVALVSMTALAGLAHPAYGQATFTAPGVTVYTHPDAFAAATARFASPTVVGFDELDASPCNNTWVGRAPFDGNTYAHSGITFSSPNGYPLYIAPGGSSGCPLFWNESNSLSVRQFPFDDNADDGNDDDLFALVQPGRHAVGFTLVDNGSHAPDEFVQFLDNTGDVIAQMPIPFDFRPFRAFAGIVSEKRRIGAIIVIERAFDGDDVNYDDFRLVSKRGGGGSGGGEHMYLLTSPMSWQNAEAQAVALGGHLATLNDAAEEAALRQRFGTLEYFWIGFNDIATEGVWQWASGQPITYTNWCTGEPNNFNDEDAAIINWAHGPGFGDCWNDLNPDAQLRGIVEIEPKK
jgi:hypothetical protein